MRASWLGTKEVLSMVERNYRIYCAMNNIPLDDTPLADGEGMDVDVDDAMDVEPEEWDGIPDEDGDDNPSFFKEEAERMKRQKVEKTPSKRKKTRVAELVKEKIRKVIEDDTELADKRAGKCDENDFLRLLSAFNDEGIHFS
jgi:18S rRNA (adenine1779-N6/adenine1780-N6)-dimethyltransferase